MATETLRPNAAGDNCEWEGETNCSACANHYDCVNAVDDTCDIWSTNDDELDLYNLPATTGEGVVNSITVYCRCQAKGAMADGEIKIVIKTDGVEYKSAEKTVNNSVWGWLSETWNQHPSNAHAWTWAEIDALQIGLEAFAGGFGEGAYCSQIYVEVDYTPTPTQTFTADALLKALDLAKTLTADTIMVLRKDSTFDADAYIKKLGFLKTLTADCILWSGTPEIELIADVLFQKLGFTKTLTANMLIRKPGTTKTLTADAMLKKLGALSTFTADAMIQALGETKTFTADTIILNRILKTLTADCIISKADVIKAFTASVMFYGMPEPCTLDLDFEHGGEIGIDFEQGGEIELIFLGGASG